MRDDEKYVGARWRNRYSPTCVRRVLAPRSPPLDMIRMPLVGGPSIMGPSKWLEPLPTLAHDTPVANEAML